MVIDGVVQIGVPGPGTAVPASLGTSQGAVSAAVGDAPEFLDVHVDQIPGVLVFIALRCRLSDRQPGALVQAGQPRHPVPGQNLAHRRAGQVKVGSDPVRSPPAAEPAVPQSAVRCARVCGSGLRRGRDDASAMPSPPRVR